MSLESALESLAESVRELSAAVKALHATAKPVPPASVPAPAAPKGKGGRPPKVKPTAPKETKPAAPAPPADAKPIRYDDILTAITAVADRKGEAAARALLAKFNSADGTPCRGAKQVVPKDYASFVAECAAA